MSCISKVDDYLSPEAKSLLETLRPRFREKANEINRIPVSVLLWGPTPTATSQIGKLRLELREMLRKNGHLAMFSEELYDENCNLSLRSQQLIQAEQYDAIISIPESPGSIAEIHDFADDIRINKKILVFLNEDFNSGYSNQSLYAISNILSCEIILYAGIHDIQKIFNESIMAINKIREYKYLFMGRI